MNTALPSRILVTLLITCLASCSTTSSRDPAIVAARDKVLSTRKTYLQGAAVGALAGAGAGAIIGNQSNDPNGAVKGAIAGAIVGLASGLIYANHVVHQRQAFKNAGDYLDGCSKIASEQQASVKNYNNTLSSRASTISKDNAMLRGAIADSQAVQRRLREEISLQQAALSQAESEKADLTKRKAQAAKIAALQHEERRLETSIERMTTSQSQSSITGP